MVGEAVGRDKRDLEEKSDFIKKLLQKRLLTVKASENVVRLLPPLNVTKKEINLALKILNNVCENYKWKTLLIYLICLLKNWEQL